MPTESGMATAPAAAPASINVLVLPADGSDPRLERIETVKEVLKPSIAPPNRLFLGSTIRLSWAGLEAEQGRSQIFTHWAGHPQPDVDLLPDTRGKYWPAEAWEKRAMCPLAGGVLRHCFYTTHTDNLKRNPHVEDAVSGDVFILRVSDIRNGRGFYVDMKPEELSPELVASNCKVAVEILKAFKVLDDCCGEASKWWGIKGHRPFTWWHAFIHRNDDRFNR